MKKFITTYKWDIVFVFVVCMVTLMANAFYASDLKALPSPIFGGDLYYQLGCVERVLATGNLMGSCSTSSENPGYFPLFTWFVAALSVITGMSALQTLLFSTYVSSMLSVGIVYLLIRRMGHAPEFALFGSLLFSISVYAIFKYTSFAALVVFPLCILAGWEFYKKQKLLQGAFLGLSLGLCTVSHSSSAVAAVLFVTGICAYTVWKTVMHEKKELLSTKGVTVLLPYVLAIVLSVSLSMLYWYDPLFSHGLETSYMYTEWNGPGVMTFGLQMQLLREILTPFTLFSFPYLLGTLALLIGILSFIFASSQDKSFRFARVVFFGWVILVLSYFITVPLLGFHLIPNYLAGVSGKIILGLTGFFGVWTLLSFVPKAQKWVLFGLGALCIVSALVVSQPSSSDRWWKVGVQGLHPDQVALGAALKEHVLPHETILTTKELAFMANSLSGRQFLVTRRAQNDAFENMDVRELAAAQILYGRDDELRTRLIDEYDISYVYWDSYWFESEYQFNQDGSIAGIFDPLILFDTPTVREGLSSANVSYIPQKWYVDPSLRSEFHPTYPLLLIDPRNYRNYTHPWDTDLSSRLEVVWQNRDVQPSAVLYKVR